MKACEQLSCGCFTQSGYYIKYLNENVDSMLFVCECCYDENFKSICLIGDFDEKQYIVQPNTLRYQQRNPFLRKSENWLYNIVKTVRIVWMTTALIFLIIISIKKHPSVRTDFTVPQLYAVINTDVNFAVHDLGQLKLKMEMIKNQLTRVLIHGGNMYD